jgi:hypothetical protein
MDAEFELVRDAVKGATLAEGARHTVTWCLDRLPELYSDFCRSYDTRYSDEIRRLVRGVLQALTEDARNRGAAEAVAGHLRGMHERLGIPVPDLRVAPVKEPRRTRKAS